MDRNIVRVLGTHFTTVISTGNREALDIQELQAVLQSEFFHSGQRIISTVRPIRARARAFLKITSYFHHICYSWHKLLCRYRKQLRMLQTV